MKTLKKLPRQACLPQQGSILPFIAAGLLILWSVFGFLVDTAVGGNFVILLAAVALVLSQRNEQSVGMYRIACLLLVLGCSQAECRGPLAVALLLTVVSLRLWSNVPLKNGPQWMRRPVWALAAMGALAILILDHVVFMIQNFQVAWLGELLALAALFVWAVSLETRIPAKVKGPRMQAVPKEGSTLFAVAVMLLMGALTFGFINTLKRLSGVDLTETIRGAFGAVYAVGLGEVWQPLLRYIISMAACGMMLLGGNRQKSFLTAITLLFFMSNPLALEYLIDGGMVGFVEVGSVAGMTVVMLFLLISAWGLKANKPVGKTSKVNLVALVVAIVMTLSLGLGTVESVRSAINSQKSIIVEAVKETGAEAVYDAAYNGELGNNTVQAAYEAAYAAVKEAVYDPAFKAAQEVGVKDVNITPEVLAQYTETIAQNIAGYAADFSMQGMEYYIYDDMVEALTEIPAGIAQQEVFGEAPAEPKDLRAEMKKSLQNEFYSEFEYSSGRGTVAEMYFAASQAVAPILFETTFEASYNTVYDGIYDLLNNVAVETANATLAEYDGTVYLRGASAVLSALPGLVEMLALILLTLGLTVQPAAKTKTMFRRVLDWCYENVGEKMQKCMKVLGGFWLFIGALGILSIPVGLLLLPTAPIQVSLVLILGGIASLIGVALNIIMTYPMFAFAQQTADVHAIRNRAPAAVLQAAVYEEAPAQQPVQQVVTVAAEETFNPDDLPEL